MRSAALLLSTACVCAALAADAADYTGLDRVALYRARSSLVKAAYALPSGEGRTLGEFVAAAPDIDRELTVWLRRLPREGRVRYFSDGSAEADVRLDPEQLQKTLDALIERSVSGGHTMRRVSLATARTWPMLWATGVAEPADRAERNGHAGWQGVTDQGVALARRGAHADALRALVARSRALKLPGGRTLGRFIDERATIEDALVEALSGSADVTSTVDPDRIATATARIPLADFTEILIETRRACAANAGIGEDDLRALPELNPETDLEASGFARPPAREVHGAPASEAKPPSGARDSLAATGRYAPPLTSAVGDAELAAEAARYDAVAQLAADVYRVKLADGRTVADVLARRSELKGDVAVFLSAARAMGKPKHSADGACETRVELPLERLWKIMSAAE